MLDTSLCDSAGGEGNEFGRITIPDTLAWIDQISSTK